MDPKNDEIPPTEPKTDAKPSKAAQSTKRPTVSSASATAVADMPTKRTRIQGKSMVPKALPDGAEKSFKYWLGCTARCPVQNVTVAGIGFPMLNENVKVVDGRTHRYPVIGTIASLTESDIRRVSERLSRVVVRWTGGQDDPKGIANSVEAVFQQRRHGQLITIPTEAEIAERKKAGLPTNRYVPMPGDEPAARYLFALLCDDQVHGNRGEVYPPPLEETGLEWPGELKE